MEIRVLDELTLCGPDGPVPIERVGERILHAVLAVHAARMPRQQHRSGYSARAASTR